MSDLIVASAVDTLMQATNQAGLRTAIGAVIGTDVQAFDAELAAIAGLTSAADKGIQFTGSGTAATFDLTTAGKALLDDADATAQKITLGLGNVDNTSDANKPVSTAQSTSIGLKQATLVSGTNIKTVNNTTLLGGGDLAVATTAQGAKADTALQPGDQKFTVVTDATTARTLGLTDNGSYVRFTNGSAIAVTVPLQATVVWLANTEVILFQAGAGQITIAGAGGVTINTPETLKSAKQYATLTLKRVALNEWDLSGNLEAA